MNLNIYTMSLKQHKKSTVLWSVTLMLLIILGMAFYPPISQSLSEIEVIFENPMMKGMLSMFAVGPDQLGTLSGFYMTYASIYVILIGGIFSMMTAVSDVGGELRDKTFEYLLTKPVKRTEVLLSKGAAILTRLVVVTVLLFLTTLVSFQFFSPDAPLQYYSNQGALENVTRAVLAHPDKIQDIWTLDEDFFMAWLMEEVYTSMPSQEDMPEGINLDNDEIADILQGLENDPHAFFEDILEEPERYMASFGIPEKERQAFTNGVEQVSATFNDMENRFYGDPSFHGQMFSSQPEYFLRQVKSSSMLKAFKTVYPSEEKNIDKLISPFQTRHLLIFHTYLFFFMVALSGLGMFLSVFLKNPKGIVTIGTGLVLVLYFLSTIMKISQTTSAYVWITPFGLIDQSMGGSVYRLDTLNVFILLVEALVFYALSLMKFQKKDV